MCELCGDASHIPEAITATNESASTAYVAPITAMGATTSYVAALLHDYSWSTTPGQAINLSYSFTQTMGYNDASLSSQTLMNATQQVQATAALQAWANVANITFTQTTGVADIDMRMAVMPVGTAGWTTAATSGAQMVRSDVVMDSGYNVDMSSGTYQYMAMMHELGHALGLKHPGNYNGLTGTGSGAFLTTAEDTRDASIMSYHDGTYTNGWTHNPETPMIYDIAAMQYLYGANHDYNSGDTTYSFNGTSHVLTIWDGAGNDTISVAGTSSNNTIDLREGLANVSTVGLTNFWVAFGANIENAVGGSGRDTIYGNALDNRLDGGASNDVLYGNEGNDTLVGGAGADSLDGGVGSDTFDVASGNDTLVGGGDADTFVIHKSVSAHITISDFSTATDGEKILLQDFTQSVHFADLNLSQAGSDVVITLENGEIITLKNVTLAQLRAESFGEETVVVPPPAPADTTSGGGDTVPADTGTGGSDTVPADTGSGGGDTVPADTTPGDTTPGDTTPGDTSGGDTGSGGVDEGVHGTAGNDNLTGTAGDDTIYGDDGNDTILGGAGANVLYGGNGNDKLDTAVSLGNNYLDGGDGKDTLLGGKDNDTLLGGAGDDSLVGGKGANELHGGEGNDKLDARTSTGGNLLEGDAGNDTLWGGVQDDTLNGGEGNDSIVGGKGANELHGGNGDDTLTATTSTGTNLLDGGEGNDSLFGGNYNDSIDGGAGADKVDANGGNDSIDGGAGNDSLFGDSGNDTINGGDDNDTINGGNGNDVLLGGNGDDLFVSSAGNDTLTGDDGNDMFVFAARCGEDVITDFEGAGVDGGDTIAIAHGIYRSLDKLMAHVSSDGIDTHIDLGRYGHVTLVGVHGLTAGDFTIV